ncbi:hypothetical protein [Anabaena sp. UHCC 0399]|uniref:hypothetical protein n=1 Tax=Anabaena sp. UHCC 0399 TaxID=3110238 RepID=UPI002B1F6CE6|nr:hypothetical protein [Anabaena sp. UHCC 0399]MEA5569210.1 hypothetical protein [Anabaena sp. UHCC 0399]
MQSPELRLLSRPAGSSKALVFIDGYLSEEKVRSTTLLDALDKVGWKHSVYHLWWDSGSDDISRLIVAPIHWHKTKFRAERVGQDYLPSLINYQIPEQSNKVFVFLLIPWERV